MQGQEQIDRAIGGCYYALFAPAGFAEALHGLARSVDAVCCGFYPRDAGELRLRLPASPDYREFLEEFYRDGWAARDHRAKRGWPLAETGRAVLVEHDVASEEDRRSLPQYHELYPRYDVPWWGAVFFRVEVRLWAVPFLRSGSQGAWSREDAERLRALAPHFERMVGLAGKLAAAGGGATLELLDRIASAAMLVDWRGAVIRMNSRAEALAGAGLRVSNGRLIAADRSADARLQRLVALAVAVRGPSQLAASEPVVIARPGRQPLLVDALPAPDILADAFLHMRAILLVTDLDERPKPSGARLGAAFGLTPAEARLAALVGSGLPPREAAEQLGVTEETARTTLKRVFAKVGVSRQSELAALLSRLVLR